MFSGIFASIGPVSGTPLLGFGDLPARPVSLIDFHGTTDNIVPYSLQNALGILKVFKTRGQLTVNKQNGYYYF